MVLGISEGGGLPRNAAVDESALEIYELAELAGRIDGPHRRPLWLRGCSPGSLPRRPAAAATRHGTIAALPLLQDAQHLSRDAVEVLVVAALIECHVDGGDLCPRGPRLLDVRDRLRAGYQRVVREVRLVHVVLRLASEQVVDKQLRCRG